MNIREVPELLRQKLSSAGSVIKENAVHTKNAAASSARQNWESLKININEMDIPGKAKSTISSTGNAIYHLPGKAKSTISSTGSAIYHLPGKIKNGAVYMATTVAESIKGFANSVSEKTSSLFGGNNINKYALVSQEDNATEDNATEDNSLTSTIDSIPNPLAFSSEQTSTSNTPVTSEEAAKSNKAKVSESKFKA